MLLKHENQIDEIDKDFKNEIIDQPDFNNYLQLNLNFLRFH